MIKATGKCPGSKIRSNGMGRGLGVGREKGPIGRSGRGYGVGRGMGTIKIKKS